MRNGTNDRQRSDYKYCAQVLSNIFIGDNAKIVGGSVVIRSAPANCTVVGASGRIFIYDGVRVNEGRIVVDLEHNMLPDPVADTLSAMQEQIENLDKRLNEYEKGESVHEGIQYPKRAKRRADAS